MDNENTNKSGCSVDPCFILFCIFLVLKLCGTIDWSWWWVTCPLWGPLAVAILFMFTVLGFIGVVEVFRK